MVKLWINKNGKELKSSVVTVKRGEFQKYWNILIDKAGGMWNGKDSFTIGSIEV